MSAGFDLLGQIITQPEAGTFTKVRRTWSATSRSTCGRRPATTPRRGSAAGSTDIVGLIDGKYIDTTWDFTGCGYYWADECQTRIGYFVDKTIALDELSQSQAYFTGRDTSTDVRKYAIGYILPFKAQIQEKIGALLANDFTSIAPYFTSGDDGGEQPGLDARTRPNMAARAGAAGPHRSGGRLHAAAVRRALRVVGVPDDVRPLVRRHDAHLRRRQRRGAGAGLRSC